jgi:trimethylamine--corrinoid protein Co-methyltransferase
MTSGDRTTHFKILDDSAVDRVIDEAIGLLEDPGVLVPTESVANFLKDAGARDGRGPGVVSIPRALVESALESAPSSFYLYDADGVERVKYGAGVVHFNPGSAAVRLMNADGRTYKEPAIPDLVDLARLVASLDQMDAQSTSLVPADVPREIGDRYRLYIALKYSAKPVVTGAFVPDGVPPMAKMLAACAGGEEELRRKPRAMFDCCPSPPLMWSEATCQNLIDCAKMGLPATLISMPLSGATGPATILGALTQHAAENLSGVVIHQVSGPGSPIVYGGSPSIFDMRLGTTPMGAIETLMLDCGIGQVGRRLGLPTHAYMGMSDSKVLDTQAGLEAATGILLGALTGVSMVSGPGMLEFESCQSFEKLVIDNDVCLMARRLLKGYDTSDSEAAGVIRETGPGGHFLAHRHTLEWFQKEAWPPTEAINRAPRSGWEAAGSTGACDRAAEIVRKRLAEKPRPVVGAEVQKELEDIMLSEARRAGMDDLLAEQ